MSRSFTHIRRLLTACTLAGAIAAIVAAQALASVSAGPDTDGWYLYALSYTQSQQAQNATPVSDVSNSLHVARLEASSTPQLRHDVWYTYGVSLTQAQQAQSGLNGSSSGSQAVRIAQPREAVTTSSPGFFDWTSAGIGAGGAVALVLLMLAGTLALRRRGRLAI
jgi:hypothetical protein